MSFLVVWNYYYCYYSNNIIETITWQTTVVSWNYCISDAQGGKLINVSESIQNQARKCRSSYVEVIICGVFFYHVFFNPYTTGDTHIIWWVLWVYLHIHFRSLENNKGNFLSKSKQYTRDELKIRLGTS